MRYVSTRGHCANQRFCDILLEGLAPDGGLYLPETYPQIDDATLTRWRNLPYADLAFEILSLYIDDIPAADLRAICRRTYTAEVFGSAAIVPLRPLVSAAAGGQALPSPEVTLRIIQRGTSTVSAGPPKDALDPADRRVLAGLTNREREVLIKLAAGLSNAEIAGSLFVSEATVKTHLSNILAKAGLRDRVQAVVFAYRVGLIPLAEA